MDLTRKVAQRPVAGLLEGASPVGERPNRSFGTAPSLGGHSVLHQPMEHLGDDVAVAAQDRSITSVGPKHVDCLADVRIFPEAFVLEHLEAQGDRQRFDRLDTASRRTTDHRTHVGAGQGGCDFVRLGATTTAELAVHVMPIARTAPGMGMPNQVQLHRR